MRAGGLTVHVVDDDASVRDSLALMLGLAGHATALYDSAEAFLDAWRGDWTGCVVADLRLPGASGIDLQAMLAARGSRMPFILITAHGDVAAARAAFLADAVDFLEKPFERAALLAAIGAAFERETRRLARSGDADKLALLTAREREVLEQAARGLHAKEIAAALGISPRTVEVHKTRIMAKLEVRNLAELVRFAVAAESQGAAK